MNIYRELPRRGARPSSLAAPSELDFPTFSTQIERTLVASYIGAINAQSATPMELLNFHVSRSVLRKLQGTTPQQQNYLIAKATQPPAQAVNGLTIYIGQFEKRFQSWGTSDPHIQTMAPYLYPPAFSPLVGFLRLQIQKGFLLRFKDACFHQYDMLGFGGAVDGQVHQRETIHERDFLARGQSQCLEGTAL